MGGTPIRRHVLTWKQTDPESEQIRFIERWQEGRVTFVELCRQFSVSRKTGYKRARRYEAYGWEGLGDWSRAPRHHPNRTPREVAERLIAAKQAHPTWGPKKLVAWLRVAEPESPLPSPQHRRGHPGPHGAGATSEASQARSTLEPALCRCRWAQRRLVH